MKSKHIRLYDEIYTEANWEAASTLGYLLFPNIVLSL